MAKNAEPPNTELSKIHEAEGHSEIPNLSTITRLSDWGALIGSSGAAILVAHLLHLPELPAVIIGSGLVGVGIKAALVNQFGKKPPTREELLSGEYHKKLTFLRDEKSIDTDDYIDELRENERLWKGGLLTNEQFEQNLFDLANQVRDAISLARHNQLTSRAGEPPRRRP